MKMSVHKYSFEHKTERNSQQTAKDSEGFLLKLDVDGDCGYSWYHCLPEFNDLPVEQVLIMLREGRHEGVLNRVLKYAEQDLQDRRMSHDPKSGFFEIENHRLVSPLIELEKGELTEVEMLGFSHIKSKCGFDLDKELNKVHTLAPVLREANIKLRLDFNLKPSAVEFSNWIERLRREAKDVIDFIEDPCIFNPELWRQWQIKHKLDLALDVQQTDSGQGVEAASVLVLKPARMNIIEFLKTLPDAKAHRYVVTHYMDHGVGVAHAASAALKLKFFIRDRLDVCGLLPAKEAMVEPFVIEQKGPHLIFADEPGVGFEKQLQELSWEIVYEQS